MFPEYRDLISQLKTSDQHFAKLFDKHNELDHQIANLENNPVAAASRDADIEALKKEKLGLKDQLYAILSKHQPSNAANSNTNS
ncbi:YdcH family protein [Faucicola atlantae]|uniref:DUF465 domain-containing protein n=1 Tax=Faucicola atlantae TaxID=34059 RepID=A0A1B8QLQ0_9GAMM|nr:YdcH family protein [Moraxella atlantae]OBX84730.1 hypothetical protein A9306_00215 [Moraxella atlantae]